MSATANDSKLLLCRGVTYTHQCDVVSAKTNAFRLTCVLCVRLRATLEAPAVPRTPLSIAPGSVQDQKEDDITDQVVYGLFGGGI